MKQNKSDVKSQIYYLGRWVDREFFRVFVYNKREKKLAKNYEEYEELIASGLWFDSVENIPKEDLKRKSKNESSKPEC
jgi:hypothetical protein